jgi:ethanolamine utilization microcompartment shell protein EutS
MGPANIIVVVTVIGKYFSAMKFKQVPMNRLADRMICSFGLCDANADSPSRGTNTTTASKKCTAYRKNATCIADSPANTNHLAEVSIIVNSVTASTIDPSAITIRSSRCATACAVCRITIKIQRYKNTVIIFGQINSVESASNCSAIKGRKPLKMSVSEISGGATDLR